MSRRLKTGGYIIAGYTDSYGSGSNDFWLIKTDSSGNKIWDRTFGGYADDMPFSVKETRDGGYIIAGYTESYGAGPRDAWLIKTDSLGNKIWDRTFGGYSGDWALSVQETSDDGYIMAGCTQSYGAGERDAWLIKTDSLGNELWAKTFGGSGVEVAMSALETCDGGYAIVGATSSFGEGTDVWLIKTDSSGNKIWDRTFGGPSYEWGRSIQETKDGGFIIVGDTAIGHGNVWLIKTDDQGNMIWNQTFGGPSYDWAYSVQETSDGGYIFSAGTESYGAGNYDIWLVKVCSTSDIDDASTTATTEILESQRIDKYTIKITDRNCDPVYLATVRVDDAVGTTGEDGKVELEITNGIHTVIAKSLDCGSAKMEHNFGLDLPDETDAEVTLKIGSCPTAVELFENSDYSGASKDFNEYATHSFGDFNDKASSVKVPEGWKLILYEHNDYKGESRLLTQDTPDLDDFSKRASSFKLVRSDAPIVTLYQDANYAGKSKHITENTPSLVDDSLFGYPIGDFNDGVSSIKVPEGYQVILYMDVDYTGAPRLLTEDTPELGDFNDEISSLKRLKLGEPIEFLSGDNTISVELSSAEGSKDTGKINTGKVTFYPKTDVGGYGVKIDYVDFEGEWCSSKVPHQDQQECQYLIQLWTEGNLLGGVLGANKENSVSRRLGTGDPCGGTSFWVTCPDLINHDTGFSITESGKYLVQVMVVHKRNIPEPDSSHIISDIVFETAWAKTEYIWYNPT